MKLYYIYKYAIPALLLILMYSATFLETKIFEFGSMNFSVWFVLSLFCFVCGWYINKSLNWKWGGKIVFAVTVAATLISVLTITIFRNFFQAEELLTENLLLYSLRSIMLGAMAFFGMTLSELMSIQKNTLVMTEKLDLFESRFKEANKEAELVLKEAQVEAARILNEAKAQSKDIFLRKEKIERELKEFVQTEKELIKKYEEDN